MMLKIRYKGFFVLFLPVVSIVLAIGEFYFENKPILLQNVLLNCFTAFLCGCLFENYMALFKYLINDRIDFQCRERIALTPVKTLFKYAILYGAIYLGAGMSALILLIVKVVVQMSIDASYIKHVTTSFILFGFCGGSLSGIGIIISRYLHNKAITKADYIANNQAEQQVEATND